MKSGTELASTVYMMLTVICHRRGDGVQARVWFKQCPSAIDAGVNKLDINKLDLDELDKYASDRDREAVFGGKSIPLRIATYTIGY